MRITSFIYLPEEYCAFCSISMTNTSILYSSTSSKEGNAASDIRINGDRYPVLYIMHYYHRQHHRHYRYNHWYQCMPDMSPYIMYSE